MSPKLNITDSLLIYTIKNGKIKQKEEYKLLLNPLFNLYFYSILKQKKIDIVICNYCQKFFINFLGLNGIKIISGLNGNPESIITMFIEGKLQHLYDCNLKNECQNILKKSQENYQVIEKEYDNALI